MSVGQSRSTSGRVFHADWYHTRPQTTGEGHHATSNGRRRRKSVLTMYSPSLLLCPQLKPTKKWQVQLTQPASNNGNFPLDIDMAVFLLGLGAQGEDAASLLWTAGDGRSLTHPQVLTKIFSVPGTLLSAPSASTAVPTVFAAMGRADGAPPILLLDTLYRAGQRRE